ncbi:MAG: response regulator [Myxococcales bacterium]|nr:response regulator [Myxococcota bacterium]MDW8284219.1 response regulator [Myxococcales bacterium]
MVERTILVVEDHAGIRESLLDLLRDEGYQAIGAANGTEALRRLEVLRPALILLDLMMPGMNGAELSACLSKDPALATIPVVVVTASRQAPLDSGIHAVGWLQKPFAIEELLAIVKKYIGDT